MQGCEVALCTTVGNMEELALFHRQMHLPHRLGFFFGLLVQSISPPARAVAPMIMTTQITERRLGSTRCTHRGKVVL